MQINFAYDASAANAPAGFLGGLASAAGFLDSLVTSPIAVTIKVGWGEDGGVPLAGNEVAAGGPTLDFQFYSAVRSRLAASVTSAADAVAVANVPAVDPLSRTFLAVSTAEEKAWGLTPFAGGGIDGNIGFSTAVPFTFDPANRAVPGKVDFIGVAEHEITHALGRISGLFSTVVPLPTGTVLDLFRYTGPGVLAQTSTQPAYFSIDGGKTGLDPFDTVLDPADWASSVHGDSFGYSQPDTLLQVTSPDITEMDALGFSVAPLRTGSYAFTAASGEALVNLNGTGQVTLAPGNHTLDVLGGADTIFAAAGDGTALIQNAGSVFFYAGSAPTETVDQVTGSGAATLVGAANNVIIYQNSTPGPGAMLVAGAGNETLFGAASSSDDQYWGSFSGGNDLMVAGSGTDILVGGSGADTLVGGSGTDVFYVINAAIIGAQVNAPAHPGQDVIYNVHPGDILALTGFDSLYGAAGSGAAAKSVSAALAGGAGIVSLRDGTIITFAGGTAGLHVASS